MQIIAEPVTITGLSHDGRGVARIDGKAQFVAGALPGEQVRLRRLRRHRNYDDAAVAEILTASPDRVTPRCPHFGVCGACVLQHLEPARQIEAKQRELLAELEHLGKVTPQAVFDPLTGPLWEYRRRARLGVRFVRAMDRAIVGFRERERPYLADLTQCHVLAKPVGELLGPLGALVTELTIRERLPQIEVAVSVDVVALVLRVLDPPTAADRERLEAFAAQQGVTFYLQPGDASTVVPLTGPAPRLWFALTDFDIELEFAPLDFIQVNGPLNERMVKRALELLAPRPGERILDLFCGLGNFTLPLARQGTQVTGVEGDAGLVARARANAVANGLGDTSSFAVADLSADCSGLPWAKQRYDRVLLDPPRAGAREILPVIDACGAHRVVYISCHPGSLARDAGVLVHELGFELKGAGVMDMFPHTSHVESVAVFERAPRGK